MQERLKLHVKTMFVCHFETVSVSVSQLAVCLLASACHAGAAEG